MKKLCGAASCLRPRTPLHRGPGGHARNRSRVSSSGGRRIRGRRSRHLLALGSGRASNARRGCTVATGERPRTETEFATPFMAAGAHGGRWRGIQEGVFPLGRPQGNGIEVTTTMGHR